MEYLLTVTTQIPSGASDAAVEDARGLAPHPSDPGLGPSPPTGH